DVDFAICRSLQHVQPESIASVFVLSPLAGGASVIGSDAGLSRDRSWRERPGTVKRYLLIAEVVLYVVNDGVMGPVGGIGNHRNPRDLLERDVLNIPLTVCCFDRLNLSCKASNVMTATPIVIDDREKTIF